MFSGALGIRDEKVDARPNLELARFQVRPVFRSAAAAIYGL
jgi:hypothetical protein